MNRRSFFSFLASAAPGIVLVAKPAPADTALDRDLAEIWRQGYRRLVVDQLQVALVEGPDWHLLNGTPNEPIANLTHSPWYKEGDYEFAMVTDKPEWRCAAHNAGWFTATGVIQRRWTATGLPCVMMFRKKGAA